MLVVHAHMASSSSNATMSENVGVTSSYSWPTVEGTRPSMIGPCAAPRPSEEDTLRRFTQIA